MQFFDDESDFKKVMNMVFGKSLQDNNFKNLVKLSILLRLWNLLLLLFLFFILRKIALIFDSIILHFYGICLQYKN